MQFSEAGTCRDAERERGRERHLKDSFSPATCLAPPSHGKCDSKEAGVWGQGVCVGDSMWGATGEGGSWIWGEVGVQVQSSAQPLPPSLWELSLLKGWASWPEKDVPKPLWL